MGHAALELAGNLVDILNSYPSRAEALSEAVPLMEENDRDWMKIGDLAGIIGNEAHKGEQELTKWFDGPVKESEA